MSTSATATNSSCARCHQTQDQLDEPMKLYTGCRSVLYCSRDCQKLAWKTHKSACLAAQAGEAPPEHNNRTTMSINFNYFSKLAKDQTSATDSGDSSSGSDAETIYYLETSTPHTYDIAVSGPYFPLDSVIRQVMHNFGDECRPGREAFQQTIRNGHVVNFSHITFPINNNPNHTRTIHLLREHNPTLAPALPCLAWVVMQTETLFDKEAMAAMQRMENKSPPIKSLRPKGSFLKQSQADAKVRQIAEELKASIRGSRVVDRSALTPGLLTLAVINDQSGDPPQGLSLMASCQ